MAFYGVLDEPCETEYTGSFLKAKGANIKVPIMIHINMGEAKVYSSLNPEAPKPFKVQLQAQIRSQLGDMVSPVNCHRGFGANSAFRALGFARVRSRVGPLRYELWL